MQHDFDRPPQIALDPERFIKLQRLAMYDIMNTLATVYGDIQRSYGLRPDACQLFLLIAVSSVQRYARAGAGGGHDGPDPLPQALSGTISRRRLAEASGLPRETVARHVRAMLDAGLVVERGRGRLATPPGLLERAQPSGVLDRVAQSVAALSARLARLGVLRLASPVEAGSETLEPTGAPKFSPPR